MKKSLSASTEENAQVPNENFRFLDYLFMDIKHFFRFSTKDPDYYKLAHEILGKDFIPPEEIMRSRKRKGIIYTNEQLAQFKKTVPAREILEWCLNNNYMLIAGPNRPMSLLELRTIKNGYIFPKRGGWYVNERVSKKDKVETKWYMIRKGPVPQSTLKSWYGQQYLISDVETVPNVAELVWAITTYKAVRDIYLLDEICVRTSSTDSDGDRISVGRFGSENLSIGSRWDSSRNDNRLALSSARK